MCLEEKMKKLITGLLIACLIFSVIGCKKSEETGPKTLKLVFVAPMVGNDYWEGVIEGAKKGGAERGVDLSVTSPGAAFDMGSVVDLIDAAIAEGVDGIMTGAYDKEAIKPSSERAAEAGIPFVLVDSDSPDSKRLAFAGTNNYNAGKLAGETMAKMTGGSARIAIMTGSVVAESAVGRINGFNDAIKAFPDMKVLTVEATDNDALGAVTKAEAIINTYPELNAIFGAQVYDGPGAGNVIKERGITNIFVIGFDEVNTMLDFIREGVTYGTLVQDTDRMGRLGVDMLIEIINNGGTRPASLAENTDTGIILVTKDNIDTYK
jgi:ribose transport system substrate-binding protein